MAVIQKKMTLKGSKRKKEVLALFDTSATYSCNRPEPAEKLGLIEKLPDTIELGTAEKGWTV